MIPVVTYYEYLPETHPDGRELLELWVKNWSAMSCSTIVLDETWAQRHPRFEEYERVTSQLPTVNPIPYERACWLRWLAYSVCAVVHERIVCVDADIANRGWNKSEFPSVLTAYEPGLASVISGNYQAFDTWIDALLKKPDIAIGECFGKPHASDEGFSGQRHDLFRYEQHCGNYPDLSYPLVHIKTNLVPPGEKKVDIFRALTGQPRKTTISVEQDATTDGGAATG